MQRSASSNVFQTNTYIQRKTSNSKKVSSQKLPKTPSFVNLVIENPPKPKRPTVHLQSLVKKSTKLRVFSKVCKIQPENNKTQLQSFENKRVFVSEKVQPEILNKSFSVPIQKENLNNHTPISLLPSTKENRQNTPITPVFNKKRYYINKKSHREKENSFLIKKSASFAKKDFSITFKQMSFQKDELFFERRNSQKEELYYVDDLKKELNRMETLLDDCNEQIPNIISHFLQTVTTFFKYKDLRIPRHPKSSVYLGRPKKLTTLIFDMDETLIHAEPYKKQLHQNSWGQNVQMTMDDGLKLEINLKIRPYIMEVLHRLKQKYEIGIFTAATETYAKQILKKIDPNNEIFDFQLFRQYCEVSDNKLAIKDLRILNDRSLENVILIDNSPHTYLYQKQNGVPILSFYDDVTDREMLKLERFFQKFALHKCQDVRQVLDEAFNLRKYTQFDSLQDLLDGLY